MKNEFSFWKDNKVSSLFTLTVDQVIYKWKTWKHYQLFDNAERGEKWYEYYYGRQAVLCFISDKESVLGLQSVFEDSDFDDLYKVLKPHLSTTTPAKQ